MAGQPEPDIASGKYDQRTDAYQIKYLHACLPLLKIYISRKSNVQRNVIRNVFLCEKRKFRKC